MDKIDEQLNNLSMVDIPSGMHQFVMRKVNYKKMQPLLFSAFIFLMASFIGVLWRIHSQLIDAEFVDMTQDFFEIFSFNVSFLKVVFVSFFEIISPLLVAVAVISLGGVIYTGKQIHTYKFA